MIDGEKWHGCWCQKTFSFDSDGMNGCLLKRDFAMRKVSVLGWQILQFISQHLQMFFFLMVVGGNQGGFMALFLENGISHFCCINQGLAG